MHARARAHARTHTHTHTLTHTDIHSRFKITLYKIHTHTDIYPPPGKLEDQGQVCTLRKIRVWLV